MKGGVELCDVICNIAIYSVDTTLYSKCDQASYFWQRVSFNRPYNSVVTDMTVDGSFLKGKCSFKMQELSFSSNLDRGSHIM